MTSCNVSPGGNGGDVCPTSVDSNNVVSSNLAACTILSGCPTAQFTQASLKCVWPFTYNGVTYTSGQCTYDGSVSGCPWCATTQASAANCDSLCNSPGVNWDYCGCRKSLSCSVKMN
ncbi:unnamed protein product [Sphagnum tenellum]